MATASTNRVIAVLAAVAVAIGAWWVVRTMDVSLPETAAPAPSSQPATATPAPATVPPIKHPVAEAQGEPYKAGPEPLPTVDASDAAAREALASLFGESMLDRMFNLQGFARRVVATVDNLPRTAVAPQVMAVRPVPGKAEVGAGDGKLMLDPRNATRYEPYVRLLVATDPAKLVGIYKHFYPVLQQAYRDLGYPDGYFNDRVIQAIDDMLAAPEVALPVELSQPHVVYTFSDSELEKLSAGKKAMIRIGPENARAVKAKLAEIRKRLTGLPRQ